MKKISTLALMAFLSCLSMMAQIELGNIKFSIKDGQKVNPNTGKITVTFPNVTGVEDPTSTVFVLEGNFGYEDTEFDGVEGTFASGVTFDLADFGLQPSSAYTLTITSVKVDGTELAAEGGYKLNFKTRGAERKLSWAFQTDAAVEAMIAEIVGTEGDGNDYWSISSKGRIATKVKFDNEEVTLDGTTVVPFLEDLLITNTDLMLLGQTASSSNNRLHMAKRNNKVVVPDCEIGDKVAIKFCYVDTKSEYSIQIPNATCEQAANEAKDSVQSQKNATTYVFEVHTPGDLKIIVNNSCLYSIDITPKSDEKFKYSVVAKDSEGNLLKTLAPEAEANAGDIIEAKYPYWLATADNKLVTHGAKGSPFVFSATVKNDTTFVVTYKETTMTDVVYLSEGEDIPGATLCTNGNAAIRSSMGKAAYVTEDTKLVTLQPGTYKIKAVLFDANKTASYVCTLSKGEGEENEIYLNATATNFDEQESDLLEITEPTDITLKAGGGDNQGLDVIVIYASTDAPEDPEGIVDVQSGNSNAAVRKVMTDGRILIKTHAGTFNTVGVEVK